MCNAEKKVQLPEVWLHNFFFFNCIIGGCSVMTNDSRKIPCRFRASVNRIYDDNHAGVVIRSYVMLCLMQLLKF